MMNILTNTIKYLIIPVCFLTADNVSAEVPRITFTIRISQPADIDLRGGDKILLYCVYGPKNNVKYFLNANNLNNNFLTPRDFNNDVNPRYLAYKMSIRDDITHPIKIEYLLQTSPRTDEYEIPTFTFRPNADGVGGTKIYPPAAENSCTAILYKSSTKEILAHGRGSAGGLYAEHLRPGSGTNLIIRKPIKINLRKNNAPSAQVGIHNSRIAEASRSRILVSEMGFPPNLTTDEIARTAETLQQKVTLLNGAQKSWYQSFDRSCVRLTTNEFQQIGCIAGQSCDALIISWCINNKISNEHRLVIKAYADFKKSKDQLTNAANKIDSIMQYSKIPLSSTRSKFKSKNKTSNINSIRSMNLQNKRSDPD